MKFLLATTLSALAATAMSQISALPPCELSCGLTAAEATPCTNPEDFNCTCQLANQAILAPLLFACLNTTCTSPAQVSAAISAGEAICATVSQTGAAVPTASVTSTFTSTASAPVSQITDGQIQAPTSTSVTVGTTVTPYTGAAATGAANGMGMLLLAAAGVAVFAL